MWLLVGLKHNKMVVTKAKASSNSGTSFGSENVVQAADGSSFFVFRSDNDGSNNFYMTFQAT